jgi:hypothetical protein
MPPTRAALVIDILFSLKTPGLCWGCEEIALPGRLKGTPDFGATYWGNALPPTLSSRTFISILLHYVFHEAMSLGSLFLRLIIPLARQQENYPLLLNAAASAGQL